MITKGKWIVTRWDAHSDIHVSVSDGSYMRFVANCGNPKADTLPTNPDAKANAQLIVTAVNACIKLNPGNPMAVAESISDLSEALKGLSPCQRPINGAEICFEWAISEKAMKVVRQALAKVDNPSAL